MANQHTKKAATARAAKKKAGDGVKEAAQLQEALNRLSKGVDVPIRMNIVESHTKAPLMNKCDEAAKHQPHFTLLPADNFTPLLVKEWIRLATVHGVPEEKLLEARQILKRIEQWRTDHPTNCKTPD